MNQCFWYTYNGSQRQLYKNDDRDIYYLDEYLTVRQFRYSYATQAKVDFTHKIWDFKNGRDSAIDYFVDELIPAILYLASTVNKPNIGLIAVPSSKVSKKASMINAISKMILERLPEIPAEDKSYKRFYDYSELIYRKQDVNTAHESAIRPSFDEQKESLGCSRDRLWRYNTAFIILDDVTTSGTMMNACRDILIENGMDEKNIMRLAISQTRK